MAVPLFHNYDTYPVLSSLLLTQCRVAALGALPTSFVDFLTTSATGNAVTLLQNNGVQVFTASVASSNYVTPRAAEFVDVNRDGQVDVVL